MKKFLFFSLFLLFFLFLNINKSFADAIITNTEDYSAGIMWQVKNYCYQHQAEDLIQPFYISANRKVNSVGFYAYSYGQVNNFKLIISSINPNFNDSNNRYSDIVPGILADVDFSLPSSVSYVQLDLSNYNVSLPSDGYLYFWFMSLDSSGLCAKGGFYGRDGSDYSSPSAPLGGNYSYSNDITGRQSYFFNPWYGGDRVKLDLYVSSVVIPSSVSINKPLSDSFHYSNSDFSNFFTLNFLPSSNDICPFQDCYVKTRVITKRVINNEVIDDRFKVHYFDQTNIGSNNTTTYPLIPLIYSGTYQSQAFMYNMQNQIIASSSPVSFFFISSLDFRTSTTSTINIDISQIYNAPECSFFDCPASWLQYGITRAFLFLFVPDESMKNNIKSLFLDIANNFKSGFPFSLLFSISNRLESNLQQLNSQDYSFKLSFLNKDMIILSTSTLNEYLGPENYDLLRQYLGYAVYLGLALLVLSVL